MRIPLITIFVFLCCSSSWAASEEFPPQVRGFWAADTQETCDTLRTKSPADLRPNQLWLKLTATDVLGSTQARFLQERKIHVPINSGAPVKLQFEIQHTNSFGLAGLLSFVDGYGGLALYESIFGGRAPRHYFKCQP